MKINPYLGGFLLITLASCSSENPDIYEPNQKEQPPQPEVTLVVPTGGEIAVEQSNKFAFDLLTDIVNHENENHQICFSPLSALNTLALATNGASHETRSNLLHILNLDGQSQAGLQILNETCREFISKLPLVDSKVNLNLTNAFWLTPSLAANPTFVQVLREYYNGAVINKDPSGETGMTEINKWVLEQTDGMIENFFSQPMDSPYGLLNTICFKGSWTSRFSPDRTHTAQFLNQDGTTSRASYMDGSPAGWYAQTEDFEMASLPFGNKGFTMSFIMPSNYAYNIGACKELTAERWTQLQNVASEDAGIDMLLPKFKFEHGIDLYSILERMFPGVLGMAEYNSFLASGENILLNKMFQRTKVEIDEEGAKAASATWMGGELAPGKIVFNRPFYFAIHERTTGAILFLGHISAF